MLDPRDEVNDESERREPSVDCKSEEYLEWCLDVRNDADLE